MSHNRHLTPALWAGVFGQIEDDKGYTQISAVILVCKEGHAIIPEIRLKCMTSSGSSYKPPKNFHSLFGDICVLIPLSRLVEIKKAFVKYDITVGIQEFNNVKSI